jgi:hypothetical protein
LPGGDQLQTDLPNAIGISSKAFEELRYLYETKSSKFLLGDFPLRGPINSQAATNVSGLVILQAGHARRGLKEINLLDSARKAGLIEAQQHKVTGDASLNIKLARLSEGHTYTNQNERDVFANPRGARPRHAACKSG